MCTTPKCRTSNCLSSENWQGKDWVSVSVYVSTVEGIRSDQSLQFLYSGSWTPEVYYMSHTGWGSSVGFIDARTYTTDITDVSVQIGGMQYSGFAFEPEASNLTMVQIGGNMGAYQADIGQDDLNVDFTSLYSSEKYINYMTPDDIVAGFYNLSLYLQNDQSNGSRSTGLARMYPSHKLSDTYNYFYNFAATLVGTVYSLCVFPAIESITPDTGSLAGGTMVTIKGYGFDTIAARFVVYVGGVPCDVTSSAQNVIFCTTRPVSSSLSSFLTPSYQFRNPHMVWNTTRGFGSPGWWVKMWDYSSYQSNRVGIDKYAVQAFGWRDNMYMSLYYQYGSSWPSTLGYDSTSSTYFYAADVASTFVAPYTGYYTFHICTDDVGTLYMSKVGVGIAETKLAYCSSWCSNGNFWLFPTQISQAVPLKRGERIYLRIRTVRKLHFVCVLITKLSRAD